jgi:hypothetical protein
LLSRFLKLKDGEGNVVMVGWRWLWSPGISVSLHDRGLAEPLTRELGGLPNEALVELDLLLDDPSPSPPSPSSLLNSTPLLYVPSQLRTSLASNSAPLHVRRQAPLTKITA